MSSIYIKQEKYYTFEEWTQLKRPKGIWRMELIDGKVYMMASPSILHQTISVDLTRQLATHLLGKKCKVFHGATARLEKDTAYIPDLMVVCDLKKIEKNYCEGAPDLIVEILSPSNSDYDRITKLKAYRKAGVKEYWIVDPEGQTVTAYRMINDFYKIEVYSIAEKDKSVPVEVLSGFEIDLTTIFQEEANEED